VIAFQVVRWKNLLSTGNVFTEIDLTGPGATLIVGENGSGKSTMMDAICFCLYGRAYREINVPQLVNTITKRDMITEVEFIIGQTRYMVRRGLKPRLFEIHVDGALMNQPGDSRDYQEVLEKQILRMSFRSFVQVSVLGPATRTSLPFMQLKTGDRRKFIEDILDQQIITAMNHYLKKRTANVEQLISANEAEQKVVNARIKMAREHAAELARRNEEVVAEKRTKQADLLKQAAECAAIAAGTQAEIDQQNAEKPNSAAIRTKLNTLQQLRNEIQGKSTRLERELEFFHDNDSCPRCKQVIDTAFKCDTIEQHNAELGEIRKGLDILQTRYDAVSEQLERAVSAQESIDKLVVQAKLISNTAEIYQSQATALETEIKKLSRVVKREAGVNEQDLLDERSALVAAHTDLLVDRGVHSAMSELLRDGGIKAKIVAEYIPTINKLLNKYLASMDFYVEFTLDGEFNEKILSRYRDEFSYASFSEGEKQRIDLALLFTWRAVAKLRNSASTNLLVMDETLDRSLDGAAVDQLIGIIQQLAAESTLFVISHRDVAADKFTKTMRFAKTKNFSSVVQD